MCIHFTSSKSLSVYTYDHQKLHNLKDNKFLILLQTMKKISIVFKQSSV